MYIKSDNPFENAYNLCGIAINQCDTALKILEGLNELMKESEGHNGKGK